VGVGASTVIGLWNSYMIRQIRSSGEIQTAADTQRDKYAIDSYKKLLDTLGEHLDTLQSHERRLDDIDGKITVAVSCRKRMVEVEKKLSAVTETTGSVSEVGQQLSAIENKYKENLQHMANEIKQLSSELQRVSDSMDKLKSSEQTIGMIRAPHFPAPLQLQSAQDT
jgi:DNA repair exonuclease SbcCD ATPase subunit